MSGDKKHKKLANDYVLIKSLGSGSFGEVYLAKYRKGGYVAVKVEDKKRVHSHGSRVYNEYKIYRNMHKSGCEIGFPKIYDFLETPDYNILVMQLLGPSLEDMFNKCKRRFKLQTVFLLADQIMDLMKSVHEAGYIHRDIKPNNFLIDRNHDNPQIYIMDFGLSKKYIVDNKHIKYRDGRSLIGTARYASVNMHMGFEPSRRDELESVGYMFVYLLKGSLPWQGLKRQRASNNHLDKIGEKKMSIKLDVLCSGLPSCFKEYLEYCRKLKFNEDPDYEYLKDLFNSSRKKLDIKAEFEWTSANE